MHPQTYYAATAPCLSFAPLAGTGGNVEVAVLGGGFAGLATARGLQERGITSVAVLEAQSIGHGASGRNGGFVFGGYSRDAADLVSDLGLQPAREFYARSRDAVALIRSRVAAHVIDCDKVEGGALLLNWFKHSTRAERRLREQARWLAEHFGVAWDEISAAQVRRWLDTDRYGGALLERDAFHFHPLKYALGLAGVIEQAGGRVHEHSPVTAIDSRDAGGFVLRTAQGASIRAAQVVVAGGGYLDALLPALTGARLPIATYVIATEPLPERLRPIQTPAALYDNRFAFDYYRALTDHRLLWGGRISIQQREPARIAELLKADMLKVFPQLAAVRIEHAWGGLMSYARHKMPQVGRLAPGLWFAQAFGGHGVAPTTVAGEWLAEAIAGRIDLPAALQRYGLTPVFGQAGLLAAQASYSWAELRDALRERLPG
ncbi:MULTISPECIES: FAD-binding oxidoreductase [unclassified Roseateles]|uniref:NAD(P)/FAD-dependent oxidoreductase n=1 Tax=unclassified Roseateles TaxID=2626991 RepID=UPI000701C94D|nr:MULTISPECIES: FAD-binding oxidoreductase [unclassified Roseateles]KQW41137.1 FAD-dependent oxidoreductase [Pelomonas sp. Root405]KRA67909.1 FAD-dependent oxidoreductase [Pelomonas sp. Root662]